MGGYTSWLHWLVVLLIVVLVFGTKKLGNVGKDLGAAIRGFKEGLKTGHETEEASAKPGDSAAQSGRVIDVDSHK